MKELNICYLTQQYGNFVSGVGTYSTNLTNSVVKKGHKVTVICPKEKKREFVTSAVRLIEIERKKWDPSHGSWFTLSFQFFLELEKLIKEEKIDIIHFTDARECFFWNYLGKNKNIFTIGTMHDYIFMEADCNPFFYKKIYNDWIKRYVYYNSVKVLEKRCLKKIDFIICVSNFVREKLVSCYKIKEKNIINVYNGINFVINRSENKKKERVILIIGNNLQGKGIKTLFKAFLLIKEKYSDLKIIAIGYDVNQKHLENYALELGIRDRVEFKGARTNKYVIEEMKKSFLYVMSSLREGFGITFLEAMAYGTPVIGGNVGGTKELIESGENGFLVNPGDYRDLADKISIILDNDLIREKFINNGFETVKNFSIKSMVDKTLKVYTDIL